MTKYIPAFPCEYDTFATLEDGTTLNVPVKASSAGMTLRDYFAAHALAICPDKGLSNEDIVRKAYRLADLMLEQREKGMRLPA